MMHHLTSAEYAWIMAVALSRRAIVFWLWGDYGTQPLLLPASIWERVH